MSIQKTYALILGSVLAIVGVWGLFSDSILGLFSVNLFQSILHLVAGAFGIYAGLKGTGHIYNMVLGWIAVALAVLGYIPGSKDLLLEFLNINVWTTHLHLAIGVLTLAVYYATKNQG